MNKRLLLCSFLLIQSVAALFAQEKLNEFVITPDGNCPFTIRPGDGEYGFVVVNTTLSDLRFTIPTAPRRLVKADFNSEKQQWILTIVPNDNNYKRYKIIINCKGFKQGEIDVLIKQKESLCFDVNPKYEVKMAFNTIGGHEFVDLGLPSGTLWASCNVGAANPEQRGDYFAWGETSPKSNYNKNTYKYMRNGDDFEITKYRCEKKHSYLGRTDLLRKLEANDDAATANWGSGWCTPTKEQCEELVEKCSWIWTFRGYKVIGPNGSSIFLPASSGMDGYQYCPIVVSGALLHGDSLLDTNRQGCCLSIEYGTYWSASLSDLSGRAWVIEFHSRYYKINSSLREQGYSVRPVCSFTNAR